MNLFESALKARMDAGAAGAETLYAQWTFDRQLIAQALQSVQMTFGHYSRHDESHSNTILLQIGRILGPKRIDQLSATDLWLLLEAAYSHDVGMIVPDSEARELWSTTDFQTHLQSLRTHEDPEYRHAAEALLKTGADRLQELSDQWPFDVKRFIMLAVSDYVRRQHAERSGQIVTEPSRIGLESPRVLIPRRLFLLLKNVCAMHGRSFEQAASMPRAEQGIGLDDAHPRFVACMLRIGDLLDLDDGRFCNVMMSTFGVQPASSQAHRRKHAAIEHLLVSPTTLEVVAVCQADDEGAFDETERWLSWVRNEAETLAARWASIAPMPQFGAFPALGVVEARMVRQVTLGDGTRPRFEVDRESLLALMRGSNVYTDEWACLRELMQNAVDATLLRLWAEHTDKVKDIEKKLARSDDSPIDAIRDLAGKAHMIDVVVEKVDAPVTDEPSKMTLRVRITDRGMGISINDIRFLQKIGASARNPSRVQAYHAMPQWLWPSGVFGIGLQSTFLVTDRVTITSRALDESEVRQVVLRKDAGGTAGGISVSLLDDASGRLPENVALRRRGGTRVEFEARVLAVPQSVSMTGQGEMGDVIREFDPLAHDSMPYFVARIRESVKNFARYSPVPIRLGGIDCESERSSRKGGIRTFDSETLLDVRVEAGPGAIRVRDEILYRGMPIDEHLGPMFFGVSVDMYFGKARDILQLSREKFSREGRLEVARRLDRTLLKYFRAISQALRGPVRPLRRYRPRSVA